MLPSSFVGTTEAGRVGQAALAFEGVDPSGARQAVGWDASSPRTGLLFLTDSCRPCRAFWLAADPDRPVVIVTPSPATESRRRVARLAAGGPKVVMASDGWNAHGVTKAPWLIVVEGAIIVTDGPAPLTWADVVAVVEG